MPRFGVAESPMIADGFSPSSVALALSVNMVCNSSTMMSGRCVRMTFPKLVFTCIWSKRFVSVVSKFGISSSRLRCRSYRLRLQERSPCIPHCPRRFYSYPSWPTVSSASALPDFSSVSCLAYRLSFLKYDCPVAAALVEQLSIEMAFVLQIFNGLSVYLFSVRNPYHEPRLSLCKKILVSTRIVSTATSVLPPPVGILIHTLGYSVPAPVFGRSGNCSYFDYQTPLKGSCRQRFDLPHATLQEGFAKSSEWCPSA